MNKGLAVSLAVFVVVGLFGGSLFGKLSTLLFNGDQATFYVSMKNTGDTNADDFQVTAYTPDLEVISSAEVSLGAGDSKGVYLPGDAGPASDEPYLVTACGEDGCSSRWYWTIG